MDVIVDRNVPLYQQKVTVMSEPLFCCCCYSHLAQISNCAYCPLIKHFLFYLVLLIPGNLTELELRKTKNNQTKILGINYLTKTQAETLILTTNTAPWQLVKPGLLIFLNYNLIMSHTRLLCQNKALLQGYDVIQFTV